MRRSSSKPLPRARNHDHVISSEVKNQHEGKLVSNQFIVLLLTPLLDDDSDTIVLRKHDKIETLIDLTNDVVFFFLMRFDDV